MLKQYKPVTPSTRFLVQVDTKKYVTTSKPYKKLTSPLKSSNGRDSFGHISCRHKSGGHKKLYRHISFKRIFFGDSVVKTIEYDPNRNCFISLVENADGTYEYVLAFHGVKVGQTITSSLQECDFLHGNTMPLQFIPLGLNIHNIELKPRAGGKLVRSAGNSATLISRDDDRAMVRMPSGEVRYISVHCFATIGTVSNPDYKNRVFGKAGRKRWLGVRPTVRGVVMNPVDHPHGGGEGKTGTGGTPVTPWGKATKGNNTRKKNKITNKSIVKKRNK
ncbi:MAG: large subunit ribosomal protein L2 [Candidatus Deianiraeaceae bacterium]|jgi:large subunit ribosomal protein L2